MLLLFEEKPKGREVYPDDAVLRNLKDELELHDRGVPSSARSEDGNMNGSECCNFSKKSKRDPDSAVL